MSKHTAGPWSVTEDGEICAGAVPLSGICIGTLYAAEDYPCLDPEDEATCDEEYKANAKLIAAAPEMFAILDELEGSFDKEIYPEQKKEDFDALDEREYTVTITAKQWRALGRALGKAQSAT